MAMGDVEHKSTFQNIIYNIAERVFINLGTGHSEYVYQKAFHYELDCHNIHSEIERHVPVSYTDSKNRKHILSSERIDIYLHKDLNSIYEELNENDIVIELKAISRIPNSIEKEQICKYIRELRKNDMEISYGILINFPQPPRANIEHIDFRIIMSL
jgi:GxxExxY protein